MTPLEKSGFVLFKNTTYEDTYYAKGLFLKVEKFYKKIKLKTNNSEVEITKEILEELIQKIEERKNNYERL
jgi:hypothetical protein